MGSSGFPEDSRLAFCAVFLPPFFALLPSGSEKFSTVPGNTFFFGDLLWDGFFIAYRWIRVHWDGNHGQSS